MCSLGTIGAQGGLRLVRHQNAKVFLEFFFGGSKTKFLFLVFVHDFCLCLFLACLWYCSFFLMVLSGLGGVLMLFDGLKGTFNP